MMGDNHPKNSRGDDRGIGVVVLEALTRCQWVREEDLARLLKLNSKPRQRILRFFEEEKLVIREHRKELVKVAKAHIATAAVASDHPSVSKEVKEKPKMYTYSYCCLDYAQICDVVRYRIHRIKKKLKKELNSRDTAQHYICHSCNKRYSAFDALQLVSYTDDYFHCETCNGELVTVSDKLASEGMGDGEDNARKCRSDKLKDMLQRIDRFGGLCPVFSEPWWSYWFEHNNPEFEITLDDDVDGEDFPGKNDSGPKVMPPWMVKEGMNLTREQRGEIPKPDEISETKDDNKQMSEDEKSIEEEYIKAYYEAWRKHQEEDAKGRMQHEGETFISDSSSDRKVGKKSKLNDEDEGIEKEEVQFAGTKTEANKLEAQEYGDEDDYEWLDGP